MIHKHEKEVNKISKCNLLHDVFNPPKLTKHLNSHYYNILHGRMSTRKGIEKFNSFQILLDSGCSSTIVIIRMVEKLNRDKYAIMQWHTQIRNITTNHKVKIYFTLLTFSTTNVMKWKCHVDYYAKGRYYMILGKYL